MAAKKTAIKLAKSENVLDTLAKAGVEVKLTKTEIADYIAEKAQEELNGEIERVSKELRTLREKTYPVSGKWKTLADAYNALLPEREKFTFTLAYHNQKYSFEEDNTFYCTMSSSPNGASYHQIQVKPEDVPEELLATPKLKAQLRELQNRREQLQTKKHRILLIEKILSGTESGKVVLGDLTKLVNKLVKE